MPAFKDTLTDAEEKLGAEIVMKALRAPARIIAENAGVCSLASAICSALSHMLSPAAVLNE